MRVARSEVKILSWGFLIFLIADVQRPKVVVSFPKSNRHHKHKTFTGMTERDVTALLFKDGIPYIIVHHKHNHLI